MVSNSSKSPTCATCTGLLKRDAFNDHQGVSKSNVGALQSSAPQCPTGGCSLLLQAILKCFPGTSTDEQIVSCGEGIVVLWVSNKRIQLYLTEDARHPKWPDITRSACYKDLGSHESLDFIRTQLAYCRNRHFSSCHIPADKTPYMPTRVLDLGIGDDGALQLPFRRSVKLINSSEVTGGRKTRRYACLSHRWQSDGKTITTTHETYAKHADGFPFSELSLVYQDAVHVMRRLDIRYLWIDSLCIIQNDPADWQAEAKTMAKVYSRALFTLALQRDTAGSLRETGNLPQIASHPSVWPPVYVRELPAHISDDNNQFSLLRRGWVYQERLLSPRVVHISDEEIAWECMKAFNCQCGHRPRWRKHLWEPSESPKVAHAEALGSLESGRRHPIAGIYERWHDIVGEYSGLELTKESDRLPAIRGCAEQIRERLDDSYSFGLWEGDSAKGLVWKSTYMSEGQRPRSPELFCLPTWSWASAHGAVDYTLIDCVGTDYKWASAFLLHTESDSGDGQTPMYWALTGQIMSGRLRLWGHPPSIGLQILRDDLELENKPAAWGKLYDHLFFPDSKLARTDWDDDQWYDIVFFRIRRGGLTTLCLVLWRYGKAIPGSGKDRCTSGGYPIYQRIGIVELRDWNSSERYRDAERRIRWHKAKEVTIALE